MRPSFFSLSLFFFFFFFFSLSSCSPLSNVTLVERDAECEVPDGHYVIDIPFISGGVMFKARRGKCYAEIGIWMFDCGCYSLTAVSPPTKIGLQVYDGASEFTLSVLGTSAIGHLPVVLNLKSDPIFGTCVGYYAGVLMKSENKDGINSFQAVMLAKEAGLCL